MAAIRLAVENPKRKTDPNLNLTQVPKSNTCTIDLSDSKISSAGAQLLGSALDAIYCTALGSTAAPYYNLDMYGCEIGDTGMEALGPGMPIGLSGGNLKVVDFTHRGLPL